MEKRLKTSPLPHCAANWRVASTPRTSMGPTPLLEGYQTAFSSILLPALAIRIHSSKKQNNNMALYQRV
jgi:hypothetical protein